MSELSEFAFSGLPPVCMAVPEGETQVTEKPGNSDMEVPGAGTYGNGNGQPFDSGGSFEPVDPSSPEGIPGEDGQDGSAEDAADNVQAEDTQDETEVSTSDSTEQDTSEQQTEYIEVTGTPEPTPVPPEPQGPGFMPGLLIGVLAGCIIGGGVSWFLSRTRKKNRVPKTGKFRMQVVTLQGVGARENQQDSLAASDPELYAEQGVLICVADGMGGLKNGGMVSRTAVSTVMSKFAALDKTDPERLVAALAQSATSAVNMVLSPDYGSGGTTLMIGYVKDGLFNYVSVGDSRICLYRDNKLIHLNRPHVFEDELLLRYINGEISYDSARNYEKRGALTSYLGMGKLKYADIPSYHIRIRSGDRIILMSDGIFNTLSDEEIEHILESPIKNVTGMMNKEIEKKHARFQDNYSAVVLAVD